METITPQYHNNPSQRTPCVLVLDTSDSMNSMIEGSRRTRIEELNEGLFVLQQDLAGDETAAHRVQLAIVCVGGVAGDADLLMNWTDAKDFVAPRLKARGSTPLGAGMQIALQCVHDQKRQLKAHGIGHTRPWIIAISDGQPTDDPKVWTEAVHECVLAERDRRCVIYPIAVGGADMRVLQQISTRTPVRQMRETKFREYFQWLSASLTKLGNSRTEDQVQLPGTDPWAYVPR